MCCRSPTSQTILQDYFADGITESLTTDLSRLSGAFVIARNTAFTFKGKNVDAGKSARSLASGTCSKALSARLSRLRVNVQLIDAETGNHLWADRFDKPVADLFEMQDEIVARLANQLKTELVSAEAQRGQRAANPDSMDLYFQGLASYNKGVNLENMDNARGFFEHALALDPGNVDALLGVGRADLEVGAAFLSDDRPARLAAAEATMGKVLSQRPNDALAHEILGIAQMETKRTAPAIAKMERALSLDLEARRSTDETGPHHNAGPHRPQLRPNLPTGLRRDRGQIKEGAHPPLKLPQTPVAPSKSPRVKSGNFAGALPLRDGRSESGEGALQAAAS